MRLHFYLTLNTQIVPFDYQHYLIGVFHKWMGWNEIHDDISLYSLSWLRGSKMVTEGFNFPYGAKWFISFWDENIGKAIMKNVQDDPVVCCGMSVREIIIEKSPKFNSKEIFSLASPVLIRKYDEDGKAKHLTFHDSETNELLTETLKKKMKVAGLNFNVNVQFDQSYLNPKTKLVTINGVHNRTNYCPVIIEGNPEAIKFAWDVGIGHSTGSCFGAIC